MPSHANRFDKAVNVAVLFTAGIVLVGAIKRQGSSSQIDLPERKAPPTFVSEWRGVLNDALSTGSTSAPIQMVVFTDVECPYCAAFHLDVERKLARQYSGRLNVAVVHLPIRSHRFASQGAVALECAARQAAPPAFIDLVYRKQDSIGLKTWASFAEESKVANAQIFVGCMTGPTPERIAAGGRWAKRLEISATPTVLLNGWRFIGLPPYGDLVVAIDALLAGETPFWQPVSSVR